MKKGGHGGIKRGMVGYTRNKNKKEKQQKGEEKKSRKDKTNEE